MLSKKIILLLVSVLLITGFFLLPRNRQWTRTVFSYWNDLPKQLRTPDTEARMRKRFGRHYTYSKIIGDALKKRGRPHALVLMPPNSYFKKIGINYRVPVPPVFYYYTGIKTVWADNIHAIEADWYVRVNNGRLVIDSVTNRKALQDTIIAFQKLGVSL